MKSQNLTCARLMVRCTGLAAIAVLFCSTAVGSAAQNDLLEELTACRAALGDDVEKSELRFARRDGEWQLVSLEASSCDHVDVIPLEDCKAIESLQLGLWHNPDVTPTRSGIAMIATFPKLRELSIDAKDLVNNIDLENTKFASVERLGLWGSRSSVERVLARLSAFPHLAELTIAAAVTNESLADLHKCQTLRSLSIFSSEITDDAMAEIAKLLELRSLDVSWCNQISERGIRKLASLMELNELRLGEVDEDLIAAMKLLPALESLVCYFIGEQADLRGLNHLRSWKLSEDVWPDKPPFRVFLPPSVEQIFCNYRVLPVFDDAKVSHVQVVKVQGFYNHKDSVVSWTRDLPNLRQLTVEHGSDADLEDIATMGNLRSISLTGQYCRYRVEAFAKLKGLKQLEVLDANGGSRMIDSGVLQNFGNLVRLSLDNLQLSESDLEPILKLKNLRSIHFRLSDEIGADPIRVIQKLADLENLEELSLLGNLTDEGLMHLLALKKLRRLDLQRSTGFSDAGLARLMTEMPSLQEVIK